MLTTLLSALASGVLMTAVFCIALLFCMLGNTVLGVSLSLKTDLFDPKILFSGLLKNLLFIVGTIFLGALQFFGDQSDQIFSAVGILFGGLSSHGIYLLILG